MASPPPVGPETLAKHIKDVAEGMRRLLDTPLKEETILLLIQQSIKVKAQRPTLEQIRVVLHNAAKLDKLYLKDT